MAEPTEAELAKARRLVCVCDDHPACVKRIAHALRDARSSSTGWVPTSERMPEGQARPVLVFVRDTAECFMDVWDWTPSLGPLSSFHRHVIAWQELPEPPSGGETGGGDG
jgi:hypothetical protein